MEYNPSQEHLRHFPLFLKEKGKKEIFFILREDKSKHFSQKQGRNFIVDVLCYKAHAVQQVCKFKFVYFLLCDNYMYIVHKRAAKHVIMLKEIFNEKGSFF